MSKRHNKTGRSKGEPRHVRLYHWLMQSDAWRTLAPAAKALYLELGFRYNGSNNGRIGLSVRDAGDALQVSKATAARAFAELEQRGFVETVRKGHFDRKKRHATEWRLTEHRCDVSDTPATKAFMRWGRENIAGPSRETVSISSETVRSFS